MFIFIYLLFLIFCGKVTVEILLIDLLVSALVYAFVRAFMGYSLKENFLSVLMIPTKIHYVAVLLKEILLANISVIKLIVGTKYDIEPVMIKFKSELKTQSKRVLLANSITLTPGTITAELSEDEFIVHCLDKDFSSDIESSVLAREVKRYEDREIKFRNKLGLELK